MQGEETISVDLHATLLMIGEVLNICGRVIDKSK